MGPQGRLNPRGAGRLNGRPWAPLGPAWAPLGPQWVPHGPAMGALGPSMVALEPPMRAPSDFYYKKALKI